MPPSALDLELRQALRDTLLARLPPASPLFAAAREADPAAAVRAALAAPVGGETLPPDHPGTPNALDFGLSLALLCAAQGNSACAVVLAHALDRRARGCADLDALCLARAWRRPVIDPAGLPAASAPRR